MAQILQLLWIQSLNNYLLIVASLIFLYAIYGAIWRLYLSPVAKLPGPWFAALTFWNEFYYDVVLGGRYTWKLEEYHQRYGECCKFSSKPYAKVP
jgi:hypothetical protein